MATRSSTKMQQLLSRAQSRSPINCRIHKRKSKYDVCGLAPAFSAARASCTAAQTSKSVFPWRHDSILPDRVLERNDYTGTFNPTARDPPILRKLIAARELNIPAWNVMPIPFYKHEWEVTLANNFAAAFQFAVGELLRSLFRAQVINEKGMMLVDSSSTNADPANYNNYDIQVPSIDDNEYLHGMMEKTLIKRFQVDQESMKLKFSMQPIEAELYHIFAVPVPGLTREIVNDNPYLRGALYRLHTTYNENGFDEHYFDLLGDFVKNGGPEKRTIIAEAVIRCYEFFQVKDASSGLVVQGMEDGSEQEEVVHIVRFEIVTDEGQDGTGREIGNWKIIDIDDLLEGNMFH